MNNKSEEETQDTTRSEEPSVKNQEIRRSLYSRTANKVLKSQDNGSSSVGVALISCLLALAAQQGDFMTKCVRTWSTKPMPKLQALAY